MMRPPFVGHRRYSITHRAVQRLRELVPGRDAEDDESLRDHLDEALGVAEDAGRAIRTLDAMLGEPQTLIPVEAFSDTLYAIIKEETVVTVLPKGHGEEILQRGQAMEQRVASGRVRVRGLERDEDRWDAPRRRWRKEAPQPVVIERIIRGGSADTEAAPAQVEAAAAVETAEAPERGTDFDRTEHPNTVVQLPERETPAVTGPVAAAIAAALEAGRRKAAVAALKDVLAHEDKDAALLPLWNALADQGVPQSLTIGDLLEAVR